VVIVQVGSADSSGTEAHQDLGILRVRRLGAILNFELFGSVDDTSYHREWEGSGFSRECPCQRRGVLRKVLIRSRLFSALSFHDLESDVQASVRHRLSMKPVEQLSYST
jgi:hypothetical protein